MSNTWINHIKSYAKQHGLSYACALTDPNCSKSYKEKQKRKAITTPASAPASAPVAAKAVAKAVTPKTESSSSAGGNAFRVIEFNHIPKSNPPFYIYFPFGVYLYKIVKIGKTRTGEKEYIVDIYQTSNWSSATINNKEYSLIKFKNSVLMNRELEWKDLFYGYKSALMLKSFDFDKPLIVNKEEFAYNAR